MKEATLARCGGLVAAAWAGAMLAIGAMATPAVFALLPREAAGPVASRIVGGEATAALAFGALALVLALQLGRQRAERGVGSRFGAELGLALAAIACVVLGHHALLPLMEEARAGRGAFSFGALHAVSAGFFVLRGVLVVALAWRFSRPAASSWTSPPASAPA